MTQHPIHTLSPPELRSYALGLRTSVARISRVAERDIGLYDQRIASAVCLTIEAWEREAELVEGFAARLEKPAPKPIANAPSASASDFSKIFDRMFAPPGARAVAHPASAMQICRDADAQCVAGCTFQQDGQCGRDKAAALAAAASDEPQQQAAGTYRKTEPASEAQGQPWYRFVGTEHDFETLAEAMEASDGGPLGLESSEWLGTRWAVIVPDADNQHHIATADTEQDARALLDLETEEETTQAGLADAVADSLAEPPPASEPKPSPIWTEERLALLRRLWPTTMHLDAIHAALNALPGEPISSPGGVKVKASKLELHRRGEAIPREYAGAAESRTARRSAPEATSAPTPTKPPAAPIKPTPAMLPEDKAEAREKLRTGEFKGARAIIEEYGCTEAEAMALVEEHRNRKGKAA